MNDALARIIAPIVRGQIRTWLTAHPGGDRHELVLGVAKRVVGEICADETVERIRAALLAGPAKPGGDGAA